MKHIYNMILALILFTTLGAIFLIPLAFLMQLFGGSGSVNLVLLLGYGCACCVAAEPIWKTAYALFNELIIK